MEGLIHGETPKPWLRKGRGWFVTIGGKQHNLGRDKEAAFQEYYRLMQRPAERRKVSGQSLAAIIDDFLEHVAKNKAPDTYRWYRDLLETRRVAPSFTVITGDKDDPRFDAFYREGSVLRLFMALFLTDMPSYMALGDLELEERVVRLREPETRQRILAERSRYPIPQLEIVMSMIENGLDKVFRLGDPPDYEPAPEESLKASAEREGREPFSLLYDWLLELEGRQLLMLTLLGYSDYDLEAQREMLQHPRTAFGLGDGGAHCGAICDASMTTSLLDHWVMRRTRGPRLDLAWAVKKMTRDTAALYGLATVLG